MVKKVKEDKKTEKVNKKETEKMSKEEKKAKKAVEKSSKKEKKQKAQKEKKPNKFIETIKKKWLINGTKTFILVVIILAVFVGISVLMKKLNLTPIDLTEDKLFTLTSESKDKVKDIDKDINIYFVGYSDDDSTLDLAKQYTKVNEKIKVEAVTQDSRPDLVQKYGIETSSEGIIVECGDNYKVLASSDLYTHDSTTYESVNVAEEKLTAAIRSVSVEELPKVYFLSGYSSFTLTSGMQYLNMYLQNEVNQVETLDILSTGKVPDEKTEKECVVNMLPNSQEKIRFAVQMEEDEDDFMEDAIHNEMCIAFNMKLLGEDNNCSEKLMIINISNDIKEFPVGEYSIDSINS